MLPKNGGTKKHIICERCPARESLLCSSMKGEDILALDEVAQRITVPDGAYLFNEEDPTDYVYNVRSGMAVLERFSTDGRRQIMAFLYGGDYVGLIPDEISSVAARALGPLEACRWHIKDIDKLMVPYPELAHRLRHIGMRVLATIMKQVFILGCRNAQEKLAFFLIHMERRQRRVLGDTGVLKLPMTRIDIADFLGIADETVSRTFTQMRQQKLIELLEPNEVRILDHNRLEKLAEIEGGAMDVPK